MTKGYYNYRTRTFIPNKPSKREVGAFLDLLNTINRETKEREQGFCGELFPLYQ